MDDIALHRNMALFTGELTQHLPDVAIQVGVTHDYIEAMVRLEMQQAGDDRIDTVVWPTSEFASMPTEEVKYVAAFYAKRQRATAAWRRDRRCP